MSEPWHAHDVDAALKAAAAGPDGLTLAEAQQRLSSHGLNEIQGRPGPSWVAVLLRQLRSPLIYALGVSAVVAIALRQFADGAVVLAVVVLNAAIGFVQEFRAGRAIQALALMVSEPAVVRRDGNWTQLPADQLVPGDLVEVAAGDRVTADLRVLHGQGLRADESALTGESVPVDKASRPVPVTTELAERSSVLHAGTLVSAGRGRGLVVETGARTQLGHISRLMDSAEDTQTPLTRGIARLGTAITRVIAVIAVVLLGVALARGYPFTDAALAAVALAVAAIPEGLPAIVTIALAIGTQRMARRHAIVRTLPAVETLGSTSVVCTDKTGTLTRNEMVVRRVWTPNAEVELEGVGYAAAGRVLHDGRHLPSVDGAVRLLLEAAVLANEGRLEGEGAQRRVLGDPTDGALLVAAERGGLSLVELAARRRVQLLPFDSERQYMASAHSADRERAAVTYLKGAPEVLLAHLSPNDAGPAREVLQRYTGDGLRVLAVAWRDGEDVDAGLDVGDLKLLGLIAMIDPPRIEVIKAVADCHAAGVDVKMITGDHAATAAAIGRELGIVGGSPPLTGPEIADLSDDELRRRVGSTAVFARVAPEHKLRLVRALQAEGAVAAMTGDGVNDGPALRQADIGVAMGVAGTAAAREAADIVLGDDNFATIAAAIEEGRRVYDNLVKALAFALPTNVGEALVILVAVLIFPIVGGQPVLPIEPVQILWINLVATVSLALPLAFEAKEPDVMRRGPRDPREPLLSRFVIARTVYVGALMCAIAVALFLVTLDAADEALGGTAPPDPGVLAEAQTLAVTSVALFQVFYLLTCRTLKEPVRSLGWWSNRNVFVGIAALLILQAGFVYVPFLQDLLHTAPLSAGQWLLAAGAGFVIVPVITVEKLVRRRRSAARATGPSV